MNTAAASLSALSTALPEIVLRWQGRVLEVCRLQKNAPLRIGAGADVDLFVPLEGGGSHELFSAAGDLRLPPGVAARTANDGAVVLDLGLHSIELRRAAREAAPAGKGSFDAFWANVVVVVVMSAVAATAALWLAPANLDNLDDDLFANPTRFRTLVLAPKPRDTAVLDRLTPPKPVSTSTVAVAPKTPKPRPPMATKAKPSDEEVVEQKLGKLFGNAGENALATVLGNPLGDDVLSAALAGLDGGRRTASSTGALTLRGSHSDAVGTGTLGGGPISTRSRGKNGESWEATGGDVGSKVDHDITVADDPPNVQGALDGEIIRRIVRSHIDQVRYCYERSLTLNPGLQGKVAVRWIIGPDGAVLSAAIETALEASVDKCLVSRVKTWRFPSPRGGGTVVVNYPFIMKKS